MPLADGLTPRRLIQSVWNQAKAFAAYSGDATYFVPRWLILRSVGVI